MGTATTAGGGRQLPRSCSWNCQGLWHQLPDPCSHWDLGHSHCCQRHHGRRGHRHYDCCTGHQDCQELRPPLLLEPLRSWAPLLLLLCGFQPCSPSFTTSMRSNLPTIRCTDVYLSLASSCAMQWNLFWVIDVLVVVNWRRESKGMTHATMMTMSLLRGLSDE